MEKQMGSGEILVGMPEAFLLGVVMVVVLSILTLVAECFVYHKAGKAWYAPIVPIYCTVVFLQIIKRPYWWLVFIFAPLVFFIITEMLPGQEKEIFSFLSIVVGLSGLIFAVRAIHDLSRFFGHGIGFTIGLILFPFVFYPVLAWGNSKYTPPKD